MPRPVSFYRWYRGKVWHVGFAQDAAACGSERPTDAETVGERAPVNARVCDGCVSMALHLYALAQAAQMEALGAVLEAEREAGGTGA